MAVAKTVGDIRVFLAPYPDDYMLIWVEGDWVRGPGIEIKRPAALLGCDHIEFLPRSPDVT